MDGAGDVRVETVLDPKLIEPTDAVVTITAGCICGSDLWLCGSKEESDHGARMGHEFVGVVTALGGAVSAVHLVDFVIAPSVASDGTCEFCREGLRTSCRHGAHRGGDDIDGGQGGQVRLP